MFNQKITQKNSLTPEEYNKFLEQQWCEQEKRQLEQKRLYKENKIQRRQNKKLMKMNQQLQAEQFRLNEAKRQEEEKRLELEQKKTKGQTKKLQENKNFQLQQNARQQAEQRKIQDEERKKQKERIELQRKSKEEEEEEERKKQQERLRRQKQLREQEEKQKEIERLEFQRKKKEQEERLKQLERIQTQRRLKEQEQKRKELGRIQLQRKLKEEQEKRIKQERLEKQRKLKEEEQKRKELERLELEKKKKLQEEMMNKMKAENEKFKKFAEEQQKGKEKVFKEKNMEIKKEINIEKTSTGEKKIKVKARIQTQDSKQKNSEKKQDKNEPEKTQIPFKDMKPAEIWQKIENIEHKCPELSHLICDEVINQPMTQVQIKASESIKQSLKAKATSNPDSVENLVFKVAQELQKSGVPIVMSQHSTAQSQICLKVLTEGFMQNAVKVTETIPDNDPACPFAFDDLENPEQFDSFSAFYKMKIAKETGLDPSRIYINSVTKGSIKVQWTTDDSDKLNASFDTQPELEERLKLHKFFQSFHLSPEDFDTRGNIQFNDTKNDVQTRGGWPYYQPVKCKRYGINVSKKYDNGDDTWLMMNGKPRQWAVAFHGVSAPKSFCAGNGGQQMKVLQSIFNGVNTGNMLRAGAAQAYQHTIAMNSEKSQYVGRGIYCSPHFQQSLNGYTNHGDEYALIFQCRVSPKAIKVCSYEQYWVINDTKNIRPYGIILIKNNTRAQYPSVQSQFGKSFSYKDYSTQIKSYISSY